MVWNENYVLCPITSEAGKEEGVLPGFFCSFSDSLTRADI